MVITPGGQRGAKGRSGHDFKLQVAQLVGDLDRSLASRNGGTEVACQR
jgi:hypothetical protein